MIPLSKSAIVIAAVSTTSAQTATGIVDTKGFDFVNINVCSFTASTNALVTLSLKEGDTTSSFANVKVSGTDFTNAEGATATLMTSAVVAATFRVDMRGRKRYLQINATPTTTAILWSNAQLYVADATPVAAATQGAANLIDV